MTQPYTKEKISFESTEVGSSSHAMNSFLNKSRNILVPLASLASAATLGVFAGNVRAGSYDAPNSKDSQTFCAYGPSVILGNIVAGSPVCRANGIKVPVNLLNFTAEVVKKDSSGAICGDPNSPKVIRSNKITLPSEGVNTVKFNVITKKPIGGNPKKGIYPVTLSAYSKPTVKDMGNDTPDVLMCGIVNESSLPNVTSVCDWGIRPSGERDIATQYCGEVWKKIYNDSRTIAAWSAGKPILAGKLIQLPRFTSPNGQCEAKDIREPGVDSWAHPQRRITWECGKTATGEVVRVEVSLEGWSKNTAGKICQLPLSGNSMTYSIDDFGPVLSLRATLDTYYTKKDGSSPLIGRVSATAMYENLSGTQDACAVPGAIMRN